MVRTAISKTIEAIDDAKGIEDCDDLQEGALSGAVVAKRSTIAGTLEGYNFGTQNSDYFTSVYAKSVEAVHRAVESIARAGRLNNGPLLENAVKQLKREKDAPPRLRIEVRGRKMRGVPLWALHKLPNRFKSIHFVDLADPACAPNLPPGIRSACIALYRDSGRNAVYAAFDGSKYLKAIQAWLDSASEPEWWQPELYWQAAIDDLRRKKIFPPEAWDADGRDWPDQPKPRRKVHNSKGRAISKIDKRTVTRR